MIGQLLNSLGAAGILVFITGLMLYLTSKL